MIKEQIKKKNRNDLIHQSRSYKKIDFKVLESEEFEVKPYLAQLEMEKARLKFKIESLMVPTIRTHFKNKEDFAVENYTCWECSSQDTIDHNEIRRLLQTI